MTASVMPTASLPSNATPNWSSTSLLGKRNQATTDAFIEGLRHATGRQHFQISTDGFQP